MTTRPYSHLVCQKRWADRALYEAISRHEHLFEADHKTMLVGILDHMHVVDLIFQHHLEELPHGYAAPRSQEAPQIGELAEASMKMGDWYACYVWNLSAREFDEPVEFLFTSGRPGLMTRGEMILHVCLHGTYHRGNVGVLLHQYAIPQTNDRMTDYLETVA